MFGELIVLSSFFSFLFSFFFVDEEFACVYGNGCVSECLYNAILVRRLDCVERCRGSDLHCPR